MVGLRPFQVTTLTTALATTTLATTTLATTTLASGGRELLVMGPYALISGIDLDTDDD